jgi:hypothetical protein
MSRSRSGHSETLLRCLTVSLNKYAIATFQLRIVRRGGFLDHAPWMPCNKDEFRVIVVEQFPGEVVLGSVRNEKPYRYFGIASLVESVPPGLRDKLRQGGFKVREV